MRVAWRSHDSGLNAVKLSDGCSIKKVSPSPKPLFQTGQVRWMWKFAAISLFSSNHQSQSVQIFIYSLSKKKFHNYMYSGSLFFFPSALRAEMAWPSEKVQKPFTLSPCNYIDPAARLKAAVWNIMAITSLFGLKAQQPLFHLLRFFFFFPFLSFWFMCRFWPNTNLSRARGQVFVFGKIARALWKYFVLCHKSGETHSRSCRLCNSR